MFHSDAHPGHRHRRARRAHARAWFLHHFLFGDHDGDESRGSRRGGSRGRGGGSRGRGGNGPFGGGPFGGRRPLRFLARKLDLDSDQVDAIAALLSDLRTERAQMSVDARRAASAIATAVAADPFDARAVTAAQAELAASRARLDEHIAGALGRIHAILAAEQRQAFAGLIREMPPGLL